MLQASRQSVEELSDDVKYLWCPAKIHVLDSPPTSLEFLRDYVATSRPCIIRNSVLSSDKNSNNVEPLLLSLDDLVLSTPDMELAVDVSPDGNADVLRRVAPSNSGSTKEKEQSFTQMFVQPEERTLSLTTFREELRKERCTELSDQKLNPLDRVFSVEQDVASSNNPEEPAAIDSDEEVVFYYSRQNDCLRTELEKLWGKSLFPAGFPWAEEAFGTGAPQAVNLWIGNEKATSSMHKDHYENLFYVLSGEKIFTLCPPADAPFLYEEDFDSGRFQKGKHHQKGWTVRQDMESDGQATKVKWIAADVSLKEDPQHLERFPLLEFAHPMEVKVPQGCMLYLPSLWFHRVSQSCETVGINWWYDMKFESPAWAYFHFLQQLKAS